MKRMVELSTRAKLLSHFGEETARDMDRKRESWYRFEPRFYINMFLIQKTLVSVELGAYSCFNSKLFWQLAWDSYIISTCIVT